MSRYAILDTSILIKDGGLLENWTPSIQFVIIDSVFNELSHVISKRDNYRSSLDKVELALSKGFAVRQHVDFSPSHKLKGIAARFRVSPTDLSLASVVEHYLQEKKDAFLVTADRKLLELCNAAGIPALQIFDLQRLLANETVVSASDLRDSDTLVTFQRRKLLTGFILGCITSSLASVAILNFDRVVVLFSTFGMVIALPILGLLLYVFRSRVPIGYGLLEIGTGLVSAGRLLLPNHDFGSYSIIEYLQILTGIYLIVRGLDNVSKGIKGTFAESFWKTFFGSRSLG